MPIGGEQPEWIRAGEDLVRRVRFLLDDHGDTLELALTESLGSREDAKTEIYQLGNLVRVFEAELWRKRAPSRKFGGKVAAALAIALGSVTGQIANLVTTDLYEEIKGAEAQAETVVQQCNVEVEVEIGPSRLVEGRASGAIDASATARGQTVNVGQAVEHEEPDETAPQEGRRLSGFSEPFFTGGRGSPADESEDESRDDEPIEGTPFGHSAAGSGSIDNPLDDRP